MAGSPVFPVFQLANGSLATRCSFKAPQLKPAQMKTLTATASRPWARERQLCKAEEFFSDPNMDVMMPQARGEHLR